MKEILVKYNDEYGTHWYHEELIQCKDCKHFSRYLDFDNGWCLRKITEKVYLDDYCSRAERKESE